MGAPTGNIEYKYFRSLQEDPQIQMMIPISMGDHYGESLIVGTSQDFFTDKNPLLPQQISFSKGQKFETTMQAVLGCNVARENNLKVGDKLIAAHGILEAAETHKHTDQPYKIVGILNKTNTPIDRTIFVDLVSVWQIHDHHSNDKHNKNHYHSYAHYDSDFLNHTKEIKKVDITFNDSQSDDINEELLINEMIKDTEKIRKAELKRKYAPVKYENIDNKQITAIVVKLVSPSYLFKIKREVNENTNYQAVNPAYEIQKLLSLIGNADKLLLVISYLVILVALISVLVSSYYIISNRTREIAIMRVIGATKNWIVSLILFEIMFICFTGWLVGIFLGHILILVASPIILKTSGVDISMCNCSFEEFFILPLILLIGALSGIAPIIKVYKLEVVKSLTLKQ